MLNIAMLLAYEAPENLYEITPVLPAWFNIFLPIMGTIHLVLAIIITSEFFVNEAELNSGNGIRLSTATTNKSLMLNFEF